MEIIDLLIALLLLVAFWRKVVRPVRRMLVDGAVALYGIRWAFCESPLDTLHMGVLEASQGWIVYEFRNGDKRMFIRAKEGILSNPWLRSMVPNYLAKKMGFKAKAPFSVWTDYALAEMVPYSPSG